MRCLQSKGQRHTVVADSHRLTPEMDCLDNRSVQSLSHVQLVTTHKLQRTRLPCPCLDNRSSERAEKMGGRNNLRKCPQM